MWSSPNYYNSKHASAAALYDVSKSFTGKLEPALNQVSFTVPEGQITLMTGQSGSGKSTALRILANIEEPDSGRAELFGEDFLSLSNRERRELFAGRVGIGFQAPKLDPGFSVLENLSGLAESLNYRPTAARLAHVAMHVGLGDKLFQDAATLSGGEQQKLALGRLLVSEPKLVLLDEPTSAIDPRGKHSLYESLRYFNECEGVSVLMISHDEQAGNYADKIIILEAGRIASNP